MMLPKLAVRNLLGAGLRTWLNVIILSFVFVVIIGMQGLYQGMSEQAVQALTATEYGGGQYWQKNYDPYDPLSIQDAHAVLPPAIQDLIGRQEAVPILIVQATSYPGGRMLPVLLKGIDPKQKLLILPSGLLDQEDEDLPALIGARMAKNSGLKTGDTVTLRWRDVNGTFDALDARIIQVMTTTVQSVDLGQIWIPLDKLRTMTGMDNEASLVVISPEVKQPPNVSGWQFKSLDFLLKDIQKLVQSKTAGASILYAILMLLAMLAVFDTQVLSIFRRRKEIGTMVALGLTKARVIWLFTLEGAMHAVLAALVAAVYGIPLLTLFARKGWALPQATDSYGIAIGEKLFPKYSIGLIIGTTLLVLVVTTIVSYLPTRKIAKLKPTDALRGKTS